MKHFFIGLLLTLIAPAAFANSCYVNRYNRNFIIYSNSTLPPLKIMSVTAKPNQYNLSAAKVLNSQVLDVLGYPFDLCDEPLNARTATSDAASSKVDDVVITVRVGYDESHYTDIMIYIKSRFLRGFKTYVLPIDPQPHGVSYVMHAIPQSDTDNVSLHFTKQGN